MSFYRIPDISAPSTQPGPILCSTVPLDTMCQDAFLHSRVESGRYQATSEVVREALRLLEREERVRDEEFQYLKSRLESGAAQAESGALLDGDEVFEELREAIEQRRRARPGKPRPTSKSNLTQPILPQPV